MFPNVRPYSYPGGRWDEARDNLPGIMERAIAGDIAARVAIVLAYEMAINRHKWPSVLRERAHHLEPLQGIRAVDECRSCLVHYARMLDADIEETKIGMLGWEIERK